MRIARFIVVATVVGAVIISTAAASSAAPGIDGLISRGSLIGAEVLNETGAGQTIVKNVPVGKKTSAVWVAQNRVGGGLAVLDGSGSSSCFRVRYHHVLGGDFTGALVAGVSVNYSGGGAVIFEVRVKVRGCAQPGDVKTVNLDVSPAFEAGLAFDRVRLKVRAK